MCVIAIKPKGVDMIDDQTIKDMWDTNSDGAGFMYLNKDNDVIINKGYMVYEEFLKNVKEIDDVDDIKETPLILHFRITTHGGTSPENTHPFPVSTQVDHLKALDVKAHLAMAHNGVISSVNTADDLSDTQIFIKDIIAPLSRFGGTFLDDYKNLIEYGIGKSKLVFLDNKGTITKFGEWKEQDGVFYSNLNHDYSNYKISTGSYYNYDYSYGKSYKDNTYSYFYDHGKFYIIDSIYKHSFAMNRDNVANGDVFLYENYGNHAYMINALTGEELMDVLRPIHMRELKDNELEEFEEVIHDTLKGYISKEPVKKTTIACDTDNRFGRLLFADSTGERFKIKNKGSFKLKKIRNGTKFIGESKALTDPNRNVFKEFEAKDDKFFFDMITRNAYYRESKRSFVEIKDFIFIDDVESSSFKGFQGTRKFKNAILTVKA